MEQLRIFNPENPDDIYPDEDVSSDNSSDQASSFNPELAREEIEKKERERMVREEVASWEPSKEGKREEEKAERNFNFNTYLAWPQNSADGADYVSAIREGLKDRLRRGYSKREGNGKIQYTPASIFETKRFQDYQSLIGIEFADPEIFDLALHGLMTLLMVRNDKSADWYYDKIFRYNPNKLHSYLTEYQNSETCDDEMRVIIDNYKERQQRKDAEKNNAAQLQIKW